MRHAHWKELLSGLHNHFFDRLRKRLWFDETCQCTCQNKTSWQPRNHVLFRLLNVNLEEVQILFQQLREKDLRLWRLDFLVKWIIFSFQMKTAYTKTTESKAYSNNCSKTLDCLAHVVHANLKKWRKTRLEAATDVIKLQLQHTHKALRISKLEYPIAKGWAQFVFEVEVVGKILASRKHDINYR